MKVKYRQKATTCFQAPAWTLEPTLALQEKSSTSLNPGSPQISTFIGEIDFSAGQVLVTLNLNRPFHGLSLKGEDAFC